MVSTRIDPTEPDPLARSGVGRTSLLIAAWRAAETERVDPLFLDSIANIFVTPAIQRWADELTATSASTRHLIGYRTRFFDDWFGCEMQRGVRQVVLLGAGLDTRALRLGRPEVNFYEIDRREVLDYKRRQLEAHGYALRSRLVACDYLRDDLFAALDGAGFDADADSSFLWEGNTMYLPAEAIDALLARLRADVRRLRISFDFLSEELIQRRTGFAGAGRLVAGFETAEAPWVTGFSDIGRLAATAGLALLEHKLMVDVVAPSRFRVALDRELFRHYAVATLGSHE